MKLTELQLRVIKLNVFVLCLMPVIFLAWDAYHHALGANPIEKISHHTGDWALRFLLITLTIGPLRGWFEWFWLGRFRRMLGLYTFFYATLHFLTYMVLDQFFDWGEIYKDIIKRPYITLGFSAYLVLMPLAVTSFDRAVNWLGKPRWQQLHQFVYIAATLGVIHYFWLVKADLRQPLFYGAWLLLLMVARAARERHARMA
jgi:sulfoxide reductase heme-binding subunit YedZ